MATEITVPLAGESSVSFLKVLGRMSPEERLAAYRGGDFTHRKRLMWTARHPGGGAGLRRVRADQTQPGVRLSPGRTDQL